jgi:carbamoylphosphate synthase small subunit
MNLDDYLKSIDIVGICGIDTRRLTRYLRDKGYVNGAITDSLENKEELLKNIKNSKLALRRLIINDDKVTMFPLNPNNKIHDITRYISKDEFDSKYEIVGKIKRHIRDFD